MKINVADKSGLIHNFIFMRKLIYAGSALAIIAVIALSAALLAQKNPGGQKHVSDKLSLKPKITRMGEKAFGELASSQTVSDSSAEKSLSAAAPLGLGGGGAAASSRSLIKTENSAEQMMPPYFQINKYVYSGNSLPAVEEKMEVLKKVKRPISNGELNSALKNFNFGLIDPAKFDNTNVINLTLSQNKDFGYNINFDFNEGMVSVYENRQTWQTESVRCDGPDCAGSQPLKAEDVPADEVLIAMADQFAKNYNINLENYGRPFVQNNWRVMYAQAEVKSDFYIPESATVVYPFLANGKEVYDLSGSKTGLQINIDIRHNIVSGLWNLAFRDYESSSYDMQTDESEILKIAERGGMYGGFIPEESEISEVKIGAPIQAYAEVYQYGSMESQLLLVPAYVFPILDKEKENVYQEAIVVPLAKDLYKDIEQPLRTMAEPVPDAVKTDLPE